MKPGNSPTKTAHRNNPAKSKVIVEKTSRFDTTFLKGKRPFLWLFGIAFIVYFHSLNFTLTYHDDDDLLITQKEFVSHLSNIPQAFNRPVFIGQKEDYFYRPVLMVSFIVDTFLGGGSFRFYHFINILLHACSVLLLFLFLKKLKIKDNWAFIFSVFFAIHPVLVQAVSWVPGRNYPLLALSALSAFIFLISFLDTRRLYWLLLHFIFIAISLFVIESAIMLPLVCLCYYFLMYENKTKKDILPLSITTAIYAVFVTGWFIIRNHHVQTDMLKTLDLKKMISEGLYGFPMYISKIFIPFHLSPTPITEDFPVTFSIILTVLIIASTFYLGFRNKRQALFGLLWFLIFIAPSFVLISGFAVFHEHRLYLPIIGIFIILYSLDFSKIVKKDNLFLIKSLGVAYAMFLLFQLFNYSISLKDKYSYNEITVATSPHSAFAWYNSAKVFDKDGRAPEAIEGYEKAIELGFPSSNFCRARLTWLYPANGQLDQAIRVCRDIIRIDTAIVSKDVYFQLYMLYQHTGQYDKALQAIEEAKYLLTDKEYYKWIFNLYIAEKAYDKARPIAAKLDEVAPNDLEIQKLLQENAKYTEGSLN